MPGITTSVSIRCTGPSWRASTRQRFVAALGLEHAYSPAADRHAQVSVRNAGLVFDEENRFGAAAVAGLGRQR